MFRLLCVAFLGWGSAAGATDLVPGKPESVKGYVHERGENPSGLMPDHQSVSFGRAGRLDVVKVAAWERALAAEPEVQRACVTAPAARLRGLLRSKGLPSATQLMPVVGCVDASVYFTLHVRRVRYFGGEGFLFVTEQFIESVTTSNEGLVAMFQGLSDDGKTWIGGSLRVRANGLRERGEDLFRDPVAFKRTISADVALLASLAPSDFEPSLDAITAAIGKLRVP